MNANRLKRLLVSVIVGVAISQVVAQQTLLPTNVVEEIRREGAKFAAQDAMVLSNKFEEIKIKAEAGDVEAQFQLGRCYHKGIRVAQDQIQRNKWWRKAADGGSTPAQTRLELYANEPIVTTNRFEEIKAMAEGGDAEAQFKLGFCYGNGMLVAGDEVECERWWHKAADAGHAEAQFWLGSMYQWELYSSSFKLVRSADLAVSARWYLKAAEHLKECS